MSHIKMLPTDKLSSPDKKYLHDRIAAVLIQRNNILVLSVAVGDLLLLGNLFHAVQQISPLCSLFKFKFLRRCLHFFLKLVQYH